MLKKHLSIQNIHAREILDSRGNPTVEVELKASDGSEGRFAVPSGASTGKHEALDLRDGDATRYNGNGVCQAIKNIHEIIAPALIDANLYEQNKNDKLMIKLDGTKNKSKLGANAILGVSMAMAHAAAKSRNIPLYRYLAGTKAKAQRLPVPMINIINGGMHANNNLDFQEFMIVPHGFTSFKEALRAGAEVFHSLKKLLHAKKLSTSVGDEGGFAPNLNSNEEALDFIMRAIERAGYKVKENISLALDVASSSFYDTEQKLYLLGTQKTQKTSEELLNIYDGLCKHYPIVSIEDAFDENDWNAWRAMTKAMGNKIQIVGDDLLVTNTERLSRAIKSKIANSILIKLNQVGTLSETFSAINMAKRAGYTCVISHRSGETEDTSIAHITVASNSGQIKTGSLSRTDRTAKYNELLRIEEDLGKQARYYPHKLLTK